ncbi:MAG: OmpA/MotB domain protein [Bacteroidota bacterium]|jgi:chemotaxis protein MotB
MKTSSISKAALLYLLFTGIAACVPQREVQNLEKEKKELERKIAVRDSLEQAGGGVDASYQELRSDYLLSLREIEQLRATNINLNESYQELLARYTNLVNQNRAFMSAASEVQESLRGQADSRLGESQEKERRLSQLEAQLNQREQRLQELESRYGSSMDMRNQEIIDLQAQLAARDQELMRAQSSLSNSLQGNIRENDLSIRQSSGRIYITVSQELLFKTGSAELDNRGKTALKSIADALKPEPTLRVLVEGHTDNTGSEAKNWSLSFDRALAVTLELMRHGISPQRITASGRAHYAPIASNASKEGRELNRRTEIILLPQEPEGN